MPEDEDFPEDADDEAVEVMSRPRTQTLFDDEHDDEVTDTTGAEFEEEYVRFLEPCWSEF